MDRKSNLFIVSTEYHLMVALSLIEDKFKAYENIILGIQIPRKRRLPPRENIETAHTYLEIECDQSVYVNYPDLRKTLHQLLSNEYENCFVFGETKPIEMYVGTALKKRGVTTILLPDGLKPYKENESGGRFRIFKRHLRNQVFCIVNGLSPKAWRDFSVVYGQSAYIQEIWLINRNHYLGEKTKPLRLFELLQTPESKSALINLYQRKESNPGIRRSKIIVYIPNILPSQKAELRELFLLKEIIKCSAWPVYIKLHPLTSAEHLKAINTVKGLSILEYKLPAELLIAELMDSIIISPWSTALIINNKNCHFVWLSALILEHNNFSNEFVVKNPTEHIKEPKTDEELISSIISIQNQHSNAIG